MIHQLPANHSKYRLPTGCQFLTSLAVAALLTACGKPKDQESIARQPESPELVSVSSVENAANTIPPTNNPMINRLILSINNHAKIIDEGSNIITSENGIRSFKDQAEADASYLRLLRVIADEVLPNSKDLSDQAVKESVRELIKALRIQGYSFDTSSKNVGDLGFLVDHELYEVAKPEIRKQRIEVGSLLLEVSMTVVRKTKVLHAFTLPENSQVERFSPANTEVNPETNDLEVILNESACEEVAKRYQFDSKLIVQGILANEAAHIAFSQLVPNAIKLENENVLEFGDTPYTMLQVEEAFSDLVSINAGQSLEFLADQLSNVSLEQYKLSKTIFDEVVSTFQKMAPELYKPNEVPNILKLTVKELCNLADQDPNIGEPLRLILAKRYSEIAGKILSVK